MAEPDNSLMLEILRELREALDTQVGGLRDDMGVLTAIVMRMDGNQQALLAEIRALHRQITRHDQRLRELEKSPT